MTYFNPLRPWGRRLGDAAGVALRVAVFQPTPPVGAETEAFV